LRRFADRLGVVAAKEFSRGDKERKTVMSVVIHGDASIAGQVR
jgi:2-oxoglutarate dehydrogenase complex dehydrogenase (E1) component-like enzyme